MAVIASIAEKAGLARRVSGEPPAVKIYGISFRVELEHTHL